MVLNWHDDNWSQDGNRKDKHNNSAEGIEPREEAKIKQGQTTREKEKPKRQRKDSIKEEGIKKIGWTSRRSRADNKRRGGCLGGRREWRQRSWRIQRLCSWRRKGDRKTQRHRWQDVFQHYKVGDVDGTGVVIFRWGVAHEGWSFTAADEAKPGGDETNRIHVESVETQLKTR